MQPPKGVQFLIKNLRQAWMRGLTKLSKAGVSEYTVFTFLSVLTGAVAGLLAVLFHETIQLLEWLGNAARSFSNPWAATLALIFLPALGMGIQRIMIAIDPKSAREKGVLSVIKAVTYRGGYIPVRQTIFHFFAPVIAIGSGGTVGPEGPIAKIGAGVSSLFGRLFGLNDSRRRMFTTAGAGASIAAIFNTPLGGIFFALELILLNDFRAPVFSALVLASVTASAISRTILGDNPTFVFDPLTPSSYNEIALFALLGLGAGLLSLLYVRYDMSVNRFFKKHIKTGKHKTYAMLFAGLCVGLAGLWTPEIYGVSYRAINKMLAGGTIWALAVSLFVFKFLLVPLTLRSGGYGGTFAPTMVMGASYGFLFSMIANQLFDLDLDPVAFMLVGMGAMLGAINSIPISAILILFEMTQNYSFILPLMLGVVVSTTIVQLVFKNSVLHRELEEEGFSLPDGRNSDILRQLRISDVMKQDYKLVHQDEPISTLVEYFLEHPEHVFFTVNEADELTGTIQESELRVVLLNFDHLRHQLVAMDVSQPGAVCIHPNNDLNHALKLFDQERCDGLAVVDPANPKIVIGCVTRQEVIAAYNRESMKFNLTESFAHEFKSINRNEAVQVTEGYAISEVPIADWMQGKSILELHLRNRWHVEVLMVKHADSPFEQNESAPEVTVPDPNYRFKAGDKVVVFGKEDALKSVKNW